MIDLNALSNDELQEMYHAGGVVSETMRVLQKSNTNIVGELLKTVENFYEWEHIPKEDVYDAHSHCQYYYHAHAKSEDGSSLHDDEHGHFHTFIRGKGIPDDISPCPLDDYDPNMDIKDVNAHLIGIGMDQMGTPIRLFTVNRWVTGETWHQATDTATLLEHFEIDHVHPSWAVNLWLSNMILLFKPYIKHLIQQRDEAITQWHTKHKSDNVYEDRGLEVTSHLDINLITHIENIENVLNAR